eukprot:scaffold7418_cov77-Cyclotella_meneghiniana.AAC.5
MKHITLPALLSILSTAVAQNETTYLPTYEPTYNATYDETSFEVPTRITGTVFYDYNSNGIRETTVNGRYESTAPEIPVTLHECGDDYGITTYTNDNGVYQFNVSPGCYYIQLDNDEYAVGPYMKSGEITQMLTNQIYENGMSDRAVIDNGVVMIVNAGLVEKTATLEAVSEETATSSTEIVVTSTEAATTTATENFFSIEKDTDDDADMVDTDDFSDVVDSIEDATISVEAVEETTPPTVLNANNLFDIPETESTANDQSLDGEEDEVIVQSNEEAESTVDGGEENLSTDADAASDEAPSTVSSPEAIIDEQDSAESVDKQSSEEGATATVEGKFEEGDSIATTLDEVPDEEDSAASDDISNEEVSASSVTEIESTIEDIAAEDEADAEKETLADTMFTVAQDDTTLDETTAEEQNEDSLAEAEEETLSDTMFTVAQDNTTLDETATEEQNEDSLKDEEITSDEETEEADKSQSKEDNTETNSDTADADVVLSDKKEPTAEPTSNPTTAPTTKPTSCVGCELTLDSIVRIQLDNINDKLDDDSKGKFEEVCTSFLDEQLSIATPPITDLKCVLVEESFESESRTLRRKLSDVYLADVEVSGKALSTPSHQTAESIKFKQLCVGTFTVQGFLFVRALKEADEGVFGAVQNARGIMTYDSSEALDGGEDIGDPTNPDAGWLSTEVLAAIAAGSAFLFVSFLVFIALKARKRRHENNKSGKNLESGIYDEFPELRSSPTNSNDTGYSSASGGKHALITPVSIRSNREEVEVDMIPDSFSGEQDEDARGRKISSLLNSRVRRDLVAPAGKLGIMVANTAGFVSAFDL